MAMICDTCNKSEALIGYSQCYPCLCDVSPKEKRIWVLTCSVEECYDCSATYNVIGTFDTLDQAIAAGKEHDKLEGHLHYSYTDIKETLLNQPEHTWGEKQTFVY